MDVRMWGKSRRRRLQRQSSVVDFGIRSSWIPCASQSVPSIHPDSSSPLSCSRLPRRLCSRASPLSLFPPFAPTLYPHPHPPSAASATAQPPLSLPRLSIASSTSLGSTQGRESERESLRLPLRGPCLSVHVAVPLCIVSSLTTSSQQQQQQQPCARTPTSSTTSKQGQQDAVPRTQESRTKQCDTEVDSLKSSGQTAAASISGPSYRISIAAQREGRHPRRWNEKIMFRRA